jgi:GAF domain-containing protein
MRRRAPGTCPQVKPLDTTALVGAFVDLADKLVDDLDPADVLQVLVDRSVQVLDVAAAGLLITDEQGALRIVVSSHEGVQLLELYQLQSEEGPCLDCYRTGEATGDHDLGSAAAAERWPRFAPAACAVGYHSVHALPMRIRGEVIGGLNLFGTRAGTRVVHEEDLAVAQALADVATITVVHNRAARDRDELARQLQAALDTRVVIEQAKGIVAAQLDISLEEAFELMRSSARSERRRLAGLAEEITQGRTTATRLRSLDGG